MNRQHWASYGPAHQQERRDRQSAERKRLRAQVIEAYGGRCNCPGCHVVHEVLLTVDHVNGGGEEYRRQYGKGTPSIHRWIIRHGFPDDFQLLCGSCNLAKADKDKCPLAGQEH